jgi:hypothetical protein
MKTMSRRALFTTLGGAALSATLLAGCTTMKDGGTTTVTLNVAKVKAYMEAGLNASATVLSTIALIPVFDTYTLPLKKAQAALMQAETVFVESFGDKLEVSYDDTSVKTLINSVINLIQQIADQIKVILSNMIQVGISVDTPTLNKVELMYNAIATILSIFKALVMTSMTYTKIPSLQHSELAVAEYKALKTLGV